MFQFPTSIIHIDNDTARVKVVDRMQGVSLVIEIGNALVEVEVVDTQELRAQGLSGRKQLEENKGMLFVFKEPGRHGFWMNDMNFAIDIIWIDKEKKVVEITENVGPETFPEVFYPKEPIQYVLETNARWVQKNSIQPGNMLEGL